MQPASAGFSNDIAAMAAEQLRSVLAQMICDPFTFLTRGDHHFATGFIVIIDRHHFWSKSYCVDTVGLAIFASTSRRKRVKQVGLDF